jgi:ABC-2 type transport system ATP-binding protein
VDFRLLGAVEVRVSAGRLPLGPRKQRFVLAVLALNVNQVVSVDRLVALTWPDGPPQTAQHAIHVRVSQLRAVLATACAERDGVEIDTQGSTYVLRADGMRVDVHRFRTMVVKARSETDDMVKVCLLRGALGMWNGPPLADVTSTGFAAQLCRGLEETRLAATEDCLEAELRLGRHRAVLDELVELTAIYPYQQRLLGQLMLALYRAGRAADALGAYQVARHHMVNELGIEPEVRLQHLQRAILCADPALDLPFTPGSARHSPLSTLPVSSPV